MEQGQKSGKTGRKPLCMMLHIDVRVLITIMGGMLARGFAGASHCL